jgi:hypothetical protein
MENKIDWLNSFAQNDLVNFFDETMEDQFLFEKRVVSIIEDTLAITLMVIKCDGAYWAVVSDFGMDLRAVKFTTKEDAEEALRDFDKAYVRYQKRQTI